MKITFKTIYDGWNGLTIVPLFEPIDQDPNSLFILSEDAVREIANFADEFIGMKVDHFTRDLLAEKCRQIIWKLEAEGKSTYERVK